MNKLERDQIYWIHGIVAQWLTIKFKHEDRGLTKRCLEEALEKHKDAKPYDMIPWRDISELNQLNPDAWHSALLSRLLEGKESLPEPPPKQNAYPVYPD